MNSVADIWTNVLQQLKKDLSETTITTWFDELEAVDIRDNTFYLYCPNDFKKRYIESLFFKNIKAVLGGTLVGPEDAPTGWKAPTELVNLSGPWTIKFVSGQTMSIPNGTILANLGGKLTLTEVSKLECQLKVNKPEDGSSPYEINDTAAVEG